jgi:hypothetical protein
VLGSVGGAVAGVFSIRRLHGSSSPYAVPLSLAVLKLPLGATTAITGLLLIRGGFVPGLSMLDFPAQIMAYAVLLGYSQQVFTGMVDQQAQRVLGPPDPPTRTAPRRDLDGSMPEGGGYLPAPVSGPMPGMARPASAGPAPAVPDPTSPAGG